MQIENWPLDRLKPYANNPHQNQEAVPAIVATIRELGFKVPIIADIMASDLGIPVRYWQSDGGLGVTLGPAQSEILV